MAKDDKEKKEEKQEKTEGKKGGGSQGLLEPIFDQVVTEYTRPTLRKIPIPILISLKKIGLAKILPLIGVALSTLVRQKKSWWSDRVGDTISEATAELRRLINEAAGEEGAVAPTGEPTKVAEKVKKSLISILLNPELEDELATLLQSLSELFKDKDGKDISDKERGKILALLGQLSPTELLGFLKAQKANRDILLNLFIKKVEEKSLTEAIKELKENLQKFKAEMKVVREELLKPAWSKIEPKLEKVGKKLKELDGKCAPGGKVHKKTTAFRSWAERLRDEEKAKH